MSGSPAHRWAEGRVERFTELAAEFARLKVDLIVAATTPAVIAAKHGELHVVAPEFDARDLQALVVVNGFIPIIPALVGTPAVFPRRRHLELVIVYKVRFQNRMPLWSRAAREEPTSANAIEASKTPRILASRKLMH